MNKLNSIKNTNIIFGSTCINNNNMSYLWSPCSEVVRFSVRLESDPTVYTHTTCHFSHIPKLYAMYVTIAGIKTAMSFN